MDARYSRTRQMVLLTLLIFAAGCTSHAWTAAPMSGAPSTPDTTTAAATASTASKDRALANASNTNTGPATSSSASFTVLTGARCAEVVGRAAAAAARLMPEGTKRAAVPTAMCRGDQLLEVTYPGSGELAWTVQITITASTAAGCQSGAGGWSAHCGRVAGHPEMIGTDVVCGVSQCEQAWLFAGGYLVNVFGYLTGPGGIPMTSHGLPGVFPIGVDALAALTS